MKQGLRIAGAQIPVSEDIDANRAAIGRAIDFALAEEAEILLTPEGSLSGYTPQFDQGAVAAALDEVVQKAADAGLGLALGTCFVESDGRCYNQLRFYSGSGAFLGFHSKTLTCGSLTDPPQGEINDYAVQALRTYDFSGWTLGGLICNDLWANPGCTPGPDPHLTQLLAGMGAQVILHAVNGGRSGDEWSRVGWNYHEANLRMRARAGRIWIVVADNCQPQDLPCSTPSGVLDPEGNWVCRTPERGEALFVHNIVLER